MRRRRFVLGFGAFATALAFRPKIAAAAIYRSQRTYDLGNQGALYVTIFEAHLGAVKCTAAVLPRESFRASIVEGFDSWTNITPFDSLARRYEARVMINGGRFNGAFAPDGLLIVDGKTIGEKRADWDGVFEIDRDGRASVTTKPQLHDAQYAVQGNVALVRDGGAMGVMREDHQPFRRTVIAQSGDAIVALVTSLVTLFNLAYMLAEYPDAFFLHRIDTAINLSGAATTAFYARTKDGSEVYEQPDWPNRDAIIFRPRAS